MDVVGPITLPQTMAYYGGSAEESSTDANFDQFCKDAIAAVDDDVDFNLYDNDGDGNAELVCVIYAGYGQNISGNHKDTIWPKCSRKNVTTSDDYTKDTSKKVVVSYMNCGAELFHVSKGNEINGFGTFIHEFSHGLGLADHYATVSKARIDDQTPEYWDLMDYGEHAGNGYAPVPYSVWEQEVMGWTTVEVLSETQDVSGMKPLVQGGKAYKFGNGANQEEWMYLENVQPRDKENQVPGFMYGHGLLVWHVAYASSKVTMYDYPNNTAGTPRVCIVPADGLVINGYRFVSKGDPTPSQPYTKEQYQTSLRLDTFSGSSEVTTLNASMELPNFKFYNGDATPIQSLTSIVEDEQSKEISFTFNDGGATAISEMRNTELGIKNAEFYNLNGQRVTQPTERGIYIQNGKKIMVR
jgi:immune inhibitor A